MPYNESSVLMVRLSRAIGIYSVEVWECTNEIVYSFLVNGRDIVLATRWDVESYLFEGSEPYGC